MIEKLTYIFSNVNGWLKFAESKHAVIIAFNGAAIFGIIQICFNSKTNYPILLEIYLYNVILFLALSILISLISFFPQTKLKWLWPSQKISIGDNLLFYDNIKKYDEETYLKALYKSMDKDVSSFSDMEFYFANQIIQNSKIVSRKYQYFKLALILDICALLTPIIGLILNLLIK